MEQAPLNPSASELLDVLGGMTFALSKAMPDLQRTQFANTLDAIARAAEMQGKPGVMSGLQQLAAAARLTPP